MDELCFFNVDTIHLFNFVMVLNRFKFFHLSVFALYFNLFA